MNKSRWLSLFSVLLVCVGMAGPGPVLAEDIPPLVGQVSTPNQRDYSKSSAVSIPNGDFESGHTAWVEYSEYEDDIITQFSGPEFTPHSGSWAAWLGGYDDEISYIQQQVTVPVSAPYLTYWHWIASEDDCGYDFGYVLVNGTVVDKYDLCTDEDTDDWMRYVVDLSAYTGQSVALQIRAETDELAISDLYVDDVSFQSDMVVACTVPSAGYATIAAALADPTCDPILVSAGTYAENLTVTRSVTIQGDDADTTIVDGGGISAAFAITNTAAVALTDLTIQNGAGFLLFTSYYTAGVRSGGGVFNWNGAVTIQDSIIYSNTSVYGGGVSNSGTVHIKNTSIMSNTSSYGGGIYNEWGSTAISDSTISYNTADDDGGGVMNMDGNLTVKDSTIDHNTVGGTPGSASTGGGLSSFAIFADATAILTNTSVISNTAIDCLGGGGIGNHASVNTRATLTLNDSLVQGNVASGNNYMLGFGGGIKSGANHSGATYTSPAMSVVTLNNSTVRGNQAVNGGGVGNGALNVAFPEVAMLTLNNSTVSGNSAAVSAGGVITQTGNGGGVFNVNANLEIVNSTISGNSAQGQPVPATQSGLGGGIANASVGITTTVSFVNATVADNTAVGGGGVGNAYLAPVPGYPPAVATFANSLIAGNSDLFGATGCLNNPGAGAATITSQGYNLEDSVTCGLATATDLPNTDPLLGPLANNGGTPTHALPSGSPAVDVIPTAACTLPTDQRGVSRPQGAFCDIGAYEYLAVCTVPSGHKTISNALADPNCDPIIVEAGTYQENLLIDRDVTIHGADADTTIVDGNYEGSTVVITNTVSVTLTGLSIINGLGNIDDVDDVGSIYVGGGIYVANGDLLLLDGILENNVALVGGGIFNRSGSIEIRDSLITENGADIGGGIYNSDRALVVNTSVISNTSASIFDLGEGGGGIANFCGGSVTATLTVENSLISYNVADEEYSQEGGIGGGIYNSARSSCNARLAIDESIISHNQAINGGGIANGTLFTSGTSEATIEQSAIANNSTSSLSGDLVGNGGGLLNMNGVVTMTNSTLSGNAANGVPHGAEDMSGLGGGLANIQTSLSLVYLFNTTVTSNTAFTDGGGLTTVLASGESSSVPRTMLWGSIVAGNSALFDDNCSSITNVGDTNPFGSLGYNLEDGDTCNLTEPTDMVDTDPSLGPLRDNGGATWTHAPFFGSPAIDAIPAGACTLTVDQRGVARPFGGGCDIGAVEVAYLVFLPLVIR